MANVVTQLARYLMILLIAIYTYYNFRYFSYEDPEDRDSLCRNQAPSSRRGILACYYGNYQNKNIWPVEAVENVVEMPFEDMLVPAPVGWEEILRTRYGDDYMSLPPREKQYRHNNTSFEIGLSQLN